MKLSQAHAETSFSIVDNTATGKTRARLDSLGLIVGARIHVISSSYAGLIVDIKGSRLAICKAVANMLAVEEVA